jgi:hypothetical protein
MMLSFGAGGKAEMLKHLSSKSKALSSNTSTVGKKKERKKKEQACYQEMQNVSIFF